MALTTQDYMLIEQRVTNEAKSTGAAYLLWFFLWWVSAHRFYLGRPGTAVLQIISYFFVVGFIWAVVDAFLIPGMIRAHKNRIRTEMTQQAMTVIGAEPRPAIAADPALR